MILVWLYDCSLPVTLTAIAVVKPETVIRWHRRGFAPIGSSAGDQPRIDRRDHSIARGRRERTFMSSGASDRFVANRSTNCSAKRTCAMSSRITPRITTRSGLIYRWARRTRFRRAQTRPHRSDSNSWRAASLLCPALGLDKYREMGATPICEINFGWRLERRDGMLEHFFGTSIKRAEI